MASHAEITGRSYLTVAASQTGTVLKTGLNLGNQGDILKNIIIIPTTVSPGAVTLIDGATSIVLFNGGANSLTELKPIPLDINIKAKNAAGFSITTGANVAIMATGVF